MNKVLYSILGILIPFIGTSLGSGLVFFMKKNMSEKFKKITVGFAAGVMVAASVWSLILPSVEMAEKQGVIAWIPATVGLVLGVIFLMIINKSAEKLEKQRNGKRLNMLLFSVTLHNIPEGMAVGVSFAAFLAGNAGVELYEAMLLAIGIAIQNIPEGAIISMPLKMKGGKKLKAFNIRRIIRHSRTDCSNFNIINDKYYSSGIAIFIIICCRRNDLCCYRGINT